MYVYVDGRTIIYPPKKRHANNKSNQDARTPQNRVRLVAARQREQALDGPAGKEVTDAGGGGGHVLQELQGTGVYFWLGI